MTAMARKSNQLSVRLDSELQKDVEECCEITGLDSSTLMRECLKAFVREVRATGEIRLPLAIIPKSEVGKKTHAQIATIPRAPSFHSTAGVNETPEEQRERISQHAQFATGDEEFRPITYKKPSKKGKPE